MSRAVRKINFGHVAEACECNFPVHCVADQLNDPARLNLTLSRAAFDLLVYVRARAEELQREDGVEAVIELQSADQTVVGRAMRGSGVVYCEAGRVIFARALALVRGNGVNVMLCSVAWQGNGKRYCAAS
eukprot:273212-Prymnesium_polylepis.1